jgi:hypothetical protein
MKKNKYLYENPFIAGIGSVLNILGSYNDDFYSSNRKNTSSQEEVAERIAGYWQNVGGYISNQMEKTQEEIEKSS